METKNRFKRVGFFGLLTLMAGISLASDSASPAGRAVAKQMNERLKTQGANWVAGDYRIGSVVSRSQSDLNFLAGAKEPSAPEVGLLQMGRLDQSTSATTEVLPTHFDWRDRTGLSYMPAIKDQGICGSCVSFAAVDTLEGQLNVARNTPAAQPLFSRQFLFSCGGGACSSGMDMVKAVQFLQDTGVPEEACLPYASGAFGTDVQCATACNDARMRAVQILSSVTPTDGIADVTAIKRALLKGPLLSSIILYEDLLYYKSGVYRQSEGRKLGSHAITLVGWDDSDKAWIVRNSWGSEWGETGYFRIAWDDANALPGRYTWSFNVNPDRNGYAVMASPTSQGVLQGVVKVQVQSSHPAVSRVEWYVAPTIADIVDDHPTARGTVTELLPDRVFSRPEGSGDGSDRSSNKNAWVAMDQFDTTRVPDGRYVMMGRIFYENGVTETVPQEIHVLNGTFEGTLALTSLSEGSQVSGIRKLQVVGTSQPVPYQKLTFVVKNVATGETIRRSTVNVANQTTWQWATKAFPNGNYEVSFEGEAGSNIVRSRPLTVQIFNRPASP